jgi:hypothetical protein
MTDPKEKSYLQRYNEAKESRSKKILQMQTMNTATKTYAKLEDDCDKLTQKIKDLELKKDIPMLSDSCKTHLSDIYTVTKYNRIEDIKSKYLEKGLLMEEDAITAYSMLTNTFHKKNTERKNNGIIEGEMDFEDETFAIDTKVNWSIFQYNRVASRPIKPLYHWQLDGYMWLWNKQKGKLVYVLLNTPEHLIAMEEKRLLYDFVGSKEDYEEACKELRRNHIYDDIPLNERIRTFEVGRSEERIARIEKRVMECRGYLNNFNQYSSVVEDEEEDTEAA